MAVARPLSDAAAARLSEVSELFGGLPEVPSTVSSAGAAAGTGGATAAGGLVRTARQQRHGRANRRNGERDGAMSELVTPNELKRLQDELEAKKAAEAIARMRKVDEEQKHLHDAFVDREIRPEAKERVNAAVRRAVENGLSEVQVITFPSAWTNDHGRRINNLEPDWPDSLEGFAKRAYQFYVKEMQPLGFKLRAQILNYPNGMPGDVGLFLSW